MLNNSNTVNDPLITVGAYLKIKTFGWVLVKNCCFIGPGCLLKKYKIKAKINVWKYNCQHVLLKKFTIFLKFKFQKKLQNGAIFF